MLTISVTSPLLEICNWDVVLIAIYTHVVLIAIHTHIYWYIIYTLHFEGSVKIMIVIGLYNIYKAAFWVYLPSLIGYNFSL